MNSIKNAYEEFKSLDILRKLLVFAGAGLVLVCIIITGRYMIGLQHLVTSDGAFFTNQLMSGAGVGEVNGSGSIWFSINRAMAKVLGLSVVEYCHRIVPIIFLVVMLSVYIKLGAHLFYKEERDGFYTYMMTCIFVSAFMLVLHMGAFSKEALEGGAYLACWQGKYVAGLIGTPALMIGLIRIVDGKKKSGIAGSACAVVLMLVANTIDAVKMLASADFISIKDMVLSYIDKGWLLDLAVFGCILSFVFDWKRIKVILLACLIAGVLLVPASLGVIVCFSLAKLVGWEQNFEKLKQLVAKMVVLAALLMVVVVSGFFSGSRATWNANFLPIQNKYRLPQDIIDAVDSTWNVDGTEPGEQSIASKVICTSEELASGIMQYSRVKSDENPKSVASSNANVIVTLSGQSEYEMTSDQILSEASQNGAIVIVHGNYNLQAGSLKKYNYKLVDQFGELNMFAPDENGEE